MAAALTQWVMRTQAGWIVRPGDGATVAVASAVIGGSLAALWRLLQVTITNSIDPVATLWDATQLRDRRLTGCAYEQNQRRQLLRGLSRRGADPARHAAHHHGRRRRALRRALRAALCGAILGRLRAGDRLPTRPG